MADTFDATEARALLDRVRAADGRAPDDPPAPGAAVARVVRDDSGRLVALAWRSQVDSVGELYVDPECRGQGIGRRLVAELLAGAGGAHGIWAHGTLPAARALAARCGLVVRRELLQLRAPLPAAHSDPLPAGVTIRAFAPGVDDAEFLRVNAAAFAWHPEQGRLSHADLDAEKTASWFDASGFFLAVPADDARPGGRVLGFHWTKVHAAMPPAEPEPLGEIYVLGVDPASPVRHLGGPLTSVGLSHLAERGLRRALLYVEADNERAVRLYRRYGFTDDAVDTVFGPGR